MVCCEICGKHYSKMGIGTHMWRVHGAGKEFDPNKGYELGTRIGWNKGLNKSTSERVLNQSCSLSETLKEKVSNGTFIPSGCTSKEYWTPDRKKQQQSLAKLRGFGAVTQSRWIKYNGKTLGSSYELEVVKDLDKHNINWDTCKRFTYIDNKNKSRTYTPDIFLVDYNVYLEPKNDFLIENINPNLGFKDTDKIQWTEEQNNIRIIILNKTQLNWEYIKSKL